MDTDTRQYCRPGVQAADSIQGARVGARGNLEPGVQAEAMCIQDGCQTHPGSPSDTATLSVRAQVGARSMPLVDCLAAQSMVRHHHCGWGSWSGTLQQHNICAVHRLPMDSRAFFRDGSRARDEHDVVPLAPSLLPLRGSPYDLAAAHASERES